MLGAGGIVGRGKQDSLNETFRSMMGAGGIDGGDKSRDKSRGKNVFFTPRSKAVGDNTPA